MIFVDLEPPIQSLARITPSTAPNKASLVSDSGKKNTGFRQMSKQFWFLLSPETICLTALLFFVILRA